MAGGIGVMAISTSSAGGIIGIKKVMGVK